MNAPGAPRTRPVTATFSHAVPPSGSGLILLDYLCLRFPYHVRRDWEERIRCGSLRVNGAPAGPDLNLRPGMRVEYRVEDYPEPEVPLSFRLVAQSGDLALVHKPAGLPVHKTGRIFVHTLANLFRQERGDSSWSPLHRLDVETSGLVAFARGKALGLFAPTHPDTRWKKLYLAGVRGRPPEEGVLDLPLAEIPGDSIRSRMHPHPAGRPARTLFRTLLRGADRALLLLRPETGRKHQIRAHCAAAGFPLIGDKLYSEGGRYYLRRLQSELEPEDFARLGAPHHLLHAFRLEITRPEGGLAAEDGDLPEAFAENFSGLAAALASRPDLD